MTWYNRYFNGFDQFIANFDESKAFQAFQVSRQAASILIAILLANVGLTKGEIGSYEMLWYVGNTLSFYWVAGLIQALLTFFPSMTKEKQAAFLLNVYLFFVGLTLFICLFLWFGKLPILQFFTERDSLDNYGLFLIFILFNWPTYLLENFYLLQKKALPIVYFGLFAFSGQVIAIILPLILGFTLTESFKALILLAILKHFWLLLFVRKNGTAKFCIAELKDWFVLALPLIGYALLGGLNFAFDQWIVNYFYNGDEEKFAIFRYGARELPLALALASAFSTAMLPVLASDLKNGLVTIKKRSRNLFHLLFGLSIILMLSSWWFFPLVFTAAFKDSVIIFNIYLLIVISRLIFSRTILMGLKDNVAVLWISIIELIFNIVLSFILIPIWGLPGTAMATVFAYMLEKLLISLYLYRKYNIPVQAYTDLRWYVGYSLALVICFLIVSM